MPSRSKDLDQAFRFYTVFLYLIPYAKATYDTGGPYLIDFVDELCMPFGHLGLNTLPANIHASLSVHSLPAVNHCWAFGCIEQHIHIHQVPIPDAPRSAGR